MAVRRLLPTWEEAPRYACEFWGTLVLSFFVPFSLGMSKTPYEALSVGFLLTAIIYALGTRSGAHVNPALTITLFVADPSGMTIKDLVYYVLSQCAGGVCGAFMAAAAVNHNPDGFHIAFTNNIEHNVKLYQAFGAEVIVVALFFWLSIQIAADLSNAYYGFGIGLANIAATIVLTPISGAGINPAVVLGNNLVADIWGCTPPYHGPSLTWTRTTVYAAGEILGGMIALAILAMTTPPRPEPAAEEQPAAADGVPSATKVGRRTTLLQALSNNCVEQWSQPQPMLIGEGGGKVIVEVPATKRRASLLMPVPKWSELESPRFTERTPLKEGYTPKSSNTCDPSEWSWDRRASQHII